MIVSVSRRTDIPAFFSDWFMQRIREQYCITANPFNSKQISIVSLRPEDVDVLVFWTKDASPLIPHLKELEELGYRYYFQYTINGYDKDFEPHVPDIEACLETFLGLAALIGPEKVIWRYDPIIFSNQLDIAYHQDRFGFLLERLHSATRRIIISFADEYRKAAQNFCRLQARGINVKVDIGEGKLQKLCENLSQQARRKNLQIYSCAEPLDMSSFGILPGKCIDDDLIFNLFGIRTTPGKDRSQRKGCGCAKSKDIGCYDTCLHGCSYCYAGTYTSGTRNRDKHDPDSPSLIDRIHTTNGKKQG